MPKELTLPHNQDAEETVLGCILKEPMAYVEVAKTLTDPQMFFSPKCRIIFECMTEMVLSNEAIDIVPLADELSKWECKPHASALEAIGGRSYLTYLTNDIVSAQNIGKYAQIVAEKYQYRKIISLAGELQETAYNQSSLPASLIAETSQKLLRVAEQRDDRLFRKVSSYGDEILEHLQLVTTGKKPTGIPFGFERLDHATAGAQKADFIVIGGRPSQGKCLGKGTRIIMYSGELRPVEDIKVGDLLMGDDSTPRKVLSLACGIDEMYEVHQNKAINYVVNESHILSLRRSRNEKRKRAGEEIDIPLREFISKSAKFQNNWKGYKVEIDFPEQDLPLDPYFLGLWLGDGKTSDVRIATTDKEIVDYLREYARSLGLQLTTNSLPNEKCPMYAISTGLPRRRAKSRSLQSKLQRLKVIGDKHIPHAFLVNSRANRLSLLAGLIDSDGHWCQKEGGYEISQSVERLARQIKYLCDTLGFRTSIAKKSTKIARIGYVGVAYKILIFGNVDTIPVRLKRKKASPWLCRRTWNQTGISIKSLGRGEYFGFTLDGNGRFLLEDGTVTHNTALMDNMAQNQAALGYSVGIFSAETKGSEYSLRTLCTRGHLDSMKLKRGQMSADDWDKLTKAHSEVVRFKYYVDDTAAIDINSLMAKAAKGRDDLGLDIIYIDYIQKLRYPSHFPNKREATNYVVASLKNLAKSLDIPVCGLSQLNRNLEMRQYKAPILSDFKESGDIEQEADLILGIWRPEHYIKTKKKGENKYQNLAEVLILKQRNGPLDIVPLYFNKYHTRFENMAAEHQTEYPEVQPF